LLKNNMDARVAADMLFQKLRGKLIVSCQALEEEPLHSSFIMGRMALAAEVGGAAGIRANSREDILEIKKNVQLPVIGIIKRDYADSEVYITSTMREIEELMEVRPEIIALDATDRVRPGGCSLKELFGRIKEKYPDQLLMADCSTLDEAIYADRLGFDLIGTTMVGYTPASAENDISADDFRILRKILANVKAPVVCEGKIDTPEKAKRALELGALTVVVGAAITRPQLITKKFVEAINSIRQEDLA